MTMKVLYIDNWSKGIHNFLFFDGLLKKENIETLLVHTSSWLNIEDETEKIDSGLLCRDVSFYKTNSLYKIIKKENPDCVFVLNTHSIVDRAIRLSCMALGIKSIYFMHGLMPPDESKIKTQINKQNEELSFGAKMQRIIKSLRRYIPAYVEAMIKNKRGMELFKFPRLLFYTYSNPPKARYYPLYPSQLLHDKCLVYSKVFKEYYKKFGYPEANIKIVGNPNNDPIFKTIKDNAFSIDNLPENVKMLVENKKHYVVYVEDSFPEFELYGWTFAYRNKFLTLLSENFKKDNIAFIIKVKQTTDLSTIICDSDNALFIKQCDIVNLIYYADFSIGHRSTVLEIPVFLNKPIVIPNWGPSKDADDYYKSNNVGFSWNSIDERIDTSINDEARKKYIEENLFIGDKPSREIIRDEIVNIVKG